MPVPDAFLGLGANLGDRLAALTEAVRRLQAGSETRVLAVSSVYESAAVGPPQPDYLNAALHVATTRSPHELLAECLRIETALGRVRGERWGPRTIDIDLLLYNDVTLSDAALTLPHPRMMERAFVLTPLAEIAPDRLLADEPVRVLAARLDASGLRQLGRLPRTKQNETSADAGYAG